MIWSQFSTKALQVTFLDINDWNKIGVNIQKKSDLKSRGYIYIIKCIILSIKISQKTKRKKNFKFSQELQKDTSVQTLSPSINLGGWAWHFEDEYIITPSKNLIES